MKFGKYDLRINDKCSEGTFTVSAYLGRKLVAWANIVESDGFLKPYEMGGEALFVDPEHRRQGIATAMYDLAEATCGKQMRPSTEQSEDGRMFWKKR
jgi:GNAT superfamily N-acetyltransferase